ncbi:predicted protein, partial [Arabidopsis lyrata subsp. lyrata]
VGKTSLVPLINKGSSIVRPPQTIGCTVGVKQNLRYRSNNEDSADIAFEGEWELWRKRSMQNKVE